MTREEFFRQFELLADAPGAVLKMRELILNLAVRGKLVPQDACDETAHAMLSRLSAGANTRSRGPQEQDDNGLFPVPDSWAWVRLPRVLNKLTDGTHHSPLNTPSGDYMYVTAKNIKNDGVQTDEITYVSRAIHEEIYSRCDPAFGDVLYIKDGATTGVATINQLSEPFSMLSSVALLKPSDAIVNRYLLWMMRSPFFYEQTRGAMKGAAIPRVTLSVIASSLLPLPPLAEQKRIVAKVDELMALCDRLEAQQKEREAHHAALCRVALTHFVNEPTPNNLELLLHDSFSVPPEDLRRTIISVAAQGRLVPQNVEDGTAAELIRRIAERRQAAGSKNYGEVTDEEQPHEVPSTWSWVRLGNISLSSDSGWSPQCMAEPRTGTDWGVLKVSAVSWGSFDPDENKALPPGASPRPQCEVRAGDFLLSRANTEDLVGRSVIVESAPPHLMMSDKIVRFVFDEDVDRAFVNMVNQTDHARAYYARNASGTSSSMKNLSREVICRLPVPLPPLREQRRIVAKVNELLSYVDQLQSLLATASATGAKLLAAAVAELTARN